MKNITKKQINQLTYEVVGAAIEVHKTLGPGLLESVYHKCMKQELTLRGIPFSSEHPVGANYKGVKLDTDLRLDLFVNEILSVELKTVEEFAPIHTSQILTYMKLLKSPKGLLINFYCQNLYKQGLETYV